MFIYNIYIIYLHTHTRLLCESSKILKARTWKVSRFIPVELGLLQTGVLTTLKILLLKTNFLCNLNLTEPDVNFCETWISSFKKKKKEHY